jgi:hypothetical protein
MGGKCGAHVKDVNSYRIFIAEFEGNGPLGRPRSKWLGGIKMELKERICNDVDYIHLPWEEE